MPAYRRMSNDRFLFLFDNTNKNIYRYVMMNEYKKIALAILISSLIYFTILNKFHNRLCPIINIGFKNATDKQILLGIVIVSVFIMAFMELRNRKKELFDVTLRQTTSPYIKNDVTVDLEDFFKFVEWYQINETDPSVTNTYTSVDTYNDEKPRLNEAIQKLLVNLDTMINTNDMNNYYQKYLLQVIAPKLNVDPSKCSIDSDCSVYQRGEYYPKPYFDSMYQFDIPYDVSVKDLTNGNDIKVNLFAFKHIMEGVISKAKQLPEDQKMSEQYQMEIYVPMLASLSLMLAIANTETYKEYVHGYQFKKKYNGLVFNPNMIRL